MITRHLVIGAGGSRAFLTGLGAVVALRLSGLKEWSTIGGVSGGSIPALFMAHGLDPADLIDRLLEIDFRELMKGTASGSDVMFEHAADDEGKLPRARGFVARLLERSSLHTDLLGEAVESVVKEWPENFWTMAMTEKSHVLFTQVGVWEYGFDGSVRELSSEPAPVGLAIRATCAIPGLLEPVKYKGLVLFDGSLSPFGGCPVAFVRRHFLAESDLVVKCRSVGKGGKRDRFLVNLGRRLLCHESRKVEVEALEADINIEPVMPELHTFRFRLSPELKLRGLLAGFNAAVGELSRHSLHFEGRLEALAQCLNFHELLRLLGVETRVE